MTGKIVRSVRDAALDLVFPPVCAVCGRWGRLLCSGCESALEPAHPPRCTLCWRQLSVNQICDAHHAPALDGARAGFSYAGVARTLVHGLKYRNLTALAPPMAELLAIQISEIKPQPDVVVPVPLTALRERSRGFNQAAALSNELAGILKLAQHRRALAREGSAQPQVRSADIETRWRNVDGVFSVRLPGLVEGRHVLVVDDVMTTGATLGACAAALKTAGAASVFGLAFARDD